MLGSLKARKPEVWKAAPIMRRLKEQMGEEVKGERAIRTRISECGIRKEKGALVKCQLIVDRW